MSEQQSFDPKTIGRATEYRAIDVTSLPGRNQTAPKGYEWAALPGGMFGMGGTVLMCAKCAAFIAIPEGHDAWHEQMEPTP